jgi:hypothetical protein
VLLRKFLWFLLEVHHYEDGNWLPFQNTVTMRRDKMTNGFLQWPPALELEDAAGLFPPLQYLSSHTLQTYTDCASLVSSKQGCGQRFPCKAEMLVEWSESSKRDGWAVPAEGHTLSSKARGTMENQTLKMN